MPEQVERWWARRQWSRGLDVPYARGTYREEWSHYPVLVRQYHAEFNAGILLSQVPPMADVFLTWQCDSGHTFVATPAEQRSRPGGSGQRRRSIWCPDCAELANPRLPKPINDPRVLPGLATRPRRAVPGRPKKPAKPICAATPSIPIGEAFRSVCAPPPASAAEGLLRSWLTARLLFEPGLNAVRLRRPFFEHLEAWPDIVLSDLRVAIEYDTTGRHGLEHVGRRERADLRKDALTRAAGWEVVRIRTGRLPALGPYDLQVGGLSKTTLAALVDTLRAIRGPLLVDAYLR